LNFLFIGQPDAESKFSLGKRQECELQGSKPFRMGDGHYTRIPERCKNICMILHKPAAAQFSPQIRRRPNSVPKISAPESHTSGAENLNAG
jgi:hypothetical protein